ncbi:MAG: UDP-N-acetylglucosamine 1-carboxyvinyltransferase [Clostridiales bacterium]|jgi:UDP-N-acetylglucosamine 1-carboxyvinyltransferase|nr:UDP-N-acetylglucosamine 1-carboxyvinyltransferase [Clostridiales bacterium]
MEYRVTGGARLEGELCVRGAKNAALPLLAASVLTNGTTVLTNCPRITDVEVSLEILAACGCGASFSEHSAAIETRGLCSGDIPKDLAEKMRSSFIFLGALLGRTGAARTSCPGGCAIGERPVDLHLDGLRRLGAEITIDGGVISAKARKLRGARIDLAFPSVGATENLMLASVLAEGETVIVNAAKEPEIADLQNFLNVCGAKIKGAGSGQIVIRGVPRLYGAEYSVMPDRVAAGTYLAAAAITGGSVILHNIEREHIQPITARFSECGAGVLFKGESLKMCAPRPLKPIERLVTGVHPEFPTDMQPQMTALLTKARGRSAIVETVFEARDKHVAELVKMGADISIKNGAFLIKGGGRLRGEDVSASDLRGGAALIIAALSAEGVTTVRNAGYVTRGYEAIEEDLKGLGAGIELTL